VADFNFDAALRWARFDPQRTLARRPDDRLPFIDSKPTSGPGLLFDTSVYIDRMQGRVPAELRQLLGHRQANHSTVAIQELMHAVGALNPADARTSAAIAQIRLAIRSMPPHRVFAPDPDTLGRAALLSGMLCRLQGYAADRSLRALHDCILFLQAQKLGLSVLTANVADFDILLQLVPSGRALLYRRV